MDNQNQDPNQTQQTQQPAPPSMDVNADTTAMPTFPAATAMPTLAPQQQQNPSQPHPLSRALDAVLKSATGGDVYYTDPNGERKLAPQSRGTLGKTLIAATLAGLLAKDEYRQSAYGPVRDFAGTAGNAAAASVGVVNAARKRPQQLSDEAAQEQTQTQTRKLMTLQNNAHLIALQSASAMQKHTNQEQNGAAVETGLAPFKEYESLRTSNTDPNQPKAFLAQGLTHDQVLGTGPDGTPAHNLTDSNVIQDGWTQKWSPEANAMEAEPTYAVLNPDLKDVALPKAVTDMLDKVNSQWKDIHQVVGGTVKIPVSAYVSAMHDYSAVMQGQQVLDTLNKTVNGADATPLSVDGVAQAARASKDKGQNILPALYQLSHAVAGGNLPDEGQRPDNLLHTLLTSPNGGGILKLIGLTPAEASDKMEAIANKRTADAKIAAEAGKIAVQKAKPITFAAAPSIANDDSETPERRAQAKAVLVERDQFEAKKAALKAAVSAAKPNTNMMTGSLPDGTQVAGTVDELKEAGLDPNKVTKLPAADQSKVGIARQLISPNGLLTNTEKDLAAFKPEELTAIGNRWKEFEAGTLGSGDPRYIALRTDARLLSTALMQAHVGSRGSESIMEHFSNLAEAGKMNGDALKTAIGTERRYVTEKAMLPKAATTPQPHVVPVGAIPGRDASGNIIGYKTADGKVVRF